LFLDCLTMCGSILPFTHLFYYLVAVEHYFPSTKHQFPNLLVQFSSYLFPSIVNNANLLLLVHEQNTTSPKEECNRRWHMCKCPQKCTPQLCLKRRGQLAQGAHLDLGEASALRDDHVDGAIRAGPPVPALGVHRLARRRLPRLLRVRDHRLQPPTTDP